MYTYDSAIGKSHGDNERWDEVDIGDMKCVDIYLTYQKVFATLSNSVLPNQVSLNLNDIRNEIAGLQVTFKEFLVQNANKTLPTSNRIPAIRTVVAEYNDAYRAGYKVIPFDPQTSIDSNVPNSARNWLAVTRKETDFKHWYESVLPMVNGFYHRTEYDVNAGYVVDGMLSMRKSGKATLGFHSFANLGKIKTIAIKPEMISTSAPGNPLFDTAIIDTGVDLSKYTVMLSIGGYMFAPGDKAYSVVGEKTVSISLQNTNFQNRFYESRTYLDFSSLNLDPFPTNENMYLVEKITSDEVIRAYLSLSQSFVILLDNDDVYTTTYQCRTSKMPGIFIEYQEPKWPMMVGEGMMANYWAKKEGPKTATPFFKATQWVLTCIDGYTRNRLMNTNDPYAQNALYPNRVPIWPAKHSFGTFLKITSDIVR